MSKVWRYTKRIAISKERQEREFLAQAGFTASVEHVRDHKAAPKGARPISHALFTVITSEPSEVLAERNYRAKVRVKAKPGTQDAEAAGGHTSSTAAQSGSAMSRRLAQELAENEERCKRSLGKRARKREQRIGGGIRLGQRRGKAIEVYGTCSYCLTSVPRRWRFNTIEWAKRPVFLCDGCIERARGRASSPEANDAMHKVVYRKRSRG